MKVKSKQFLEESITEEISFSWTTSLSQIPPEEWDSCFEQDDILNCYALANAVENSQLENVELYYLLGHVGNRLLCVTPCFSYTTALEVLAPEGIQNIIFKIRKYFPKFLKLNSFFVGSPIAICKSSLGIEKILKTKLRYTLSQLKEQWVAKAKQIGSHVVVLKEIEDRDLEFMGSSILSNFHIFPSMPSAHIELKPNISYLDSLRSSYRVTYKKRRKLFNEIENRWFLLNEISACADELYPLYFQIVERSNNSFNTLTADLFSEILKQVTDNSFCIVAQNRNGEYLAFAIVLIKNTELHPLYCGISYKYRDKYSLYYNLLYRLIDEGEIRGCHTINLGQTAYEAKSLIGASFKNLYIGVQPLTQATSLIVKIAGSALFPQTILPTHHVFKDGI